MRLIIHNVQKLRVNRRIVLQENDPSLLPKMKESAVLKVQPTLEDLAEVTIVNRFDPGRKKVRGVEIFLNGSHCEISSAAYLKLLQKQPDALANPAVIENLLYLHEDRFISPITKELFSKIFEAQRALIANKQLQIIQDLEKNLNQQINQIKNDIIRVEKRLQSIEKQIEKIEEEIKLDPEKKYRETDRLILKKSHLEVEKRELDQYILRVRDIQIGATKDLGNDGSGMGLQAVKEKWGGIDPNLNIRYVAARYIAILEQKNRWDKQLTARKTAISEYQVELYQTLWKDVKRNLKSEVTTELQRQPVFHFIQEIAKSDMRSSKMRSRDKKKWQSEEPPPQSVTAEIQHLSFKYSQALIDQYSDYFMDRVMEAQKDAIKEGQDHFWGLVDVLGDATQINNVASILDQVDISAPLWQELKDAWLIDIAKIWVKHEDSSFFDALSRKKGDSLNAMTVKFHNWLEEKTGHKIADFRRLNFSVDLSPKIMEKIQPTKEKVKKGLEVKENALDKLEMFFVKAKSKIKKSIPSCKIQPLGTIRSDFRAEAVPLARQFQGIARPYDMELNAQNHFMVSTLRFFRMHPTPTLKSSSTLSDADFIQYETDILNYLILLEQNKGLDNQKERIVSFINQILKTFAETSPFAPSEDTLKAISNSLIKVHTKDESIELAAAVTAMNNSEREECLSAFLTLCLLSSHNEGRVVVSQELYAIMRQWLRLFTEIPPHLISFLNKMEVVMESTQFSQCLMNDVRLVQQAVIRSPIGLEGIEGGVATIQDSLHNYANSLHDEDQARDLADRFELRAAISLVPRQILRYYPINNWNEVESRDKLGSVQGREFFERTFIEAYLQVSPLEQKILEKWIINGIEVSEKFETIKTKMKVPTSLFLKQIKQKIGIQTEQENLQIRTFIDHLIGEQSTEGQDRIFGFAMAIRSYVADLKKELAKSQPNQKELNSLYAEISCARLSYELLLEPASESVKEAFERNFEYRREMHGALCEMRSIGQQLSDWIHNMEKNGGSEVLQEKFLAYQTRGQLKGEFSQLQADQKFVSVKNVNGFVTFSGNNMNWDLEHGNLYKGNSRTTMLPSSIKIDEQLQSLKLDSLPFQKRGSLYIYSENEEPLIILKETPEGLIIHRKMKMRNRSQMLQHISLDEMNSLPEAIRDRLGIKQYWLGPKNRIHGYDQEGKLVATLAKNEEGWSLITQLNQIYTIPSIEKQDALLTQLQKVFALGEILQGTNGYWIPSIGMTVTLDGICSGGQFDGMRLSDEGDVGLLLKKVLSKADEAALSAIEREIEAARVKISVLEKENASGIVTIEGTTLLRKNAIKTLQKKLEELSKKRASVENPIFLVFGMDSDSQTLKQAESAYKEASQKIVQAKKKYLDELFEGGIKTLRNWQALQEARDQLSRAKDTIDSLRLKLPPYFSYTIGSDAHLKPSSFSAAFYMIGLNIEKGAYVLSLLSSISIESPLTSKELKDLVFLKDSFAKKENPSVQDKEIVLFINLMQLKHHQLAREYSIRGKIANWDLKEFERLKNETQREATALAVQLNGCSASKIIREAWQEIACEFVVDDPLKQFLSPSRIGVQMPKIQQLNLVANLKNSPIETIGMAQDVKWTLKSIKGNLEETQIELIEKLAKLEGAEEENKAQERGFFFENYGLINDETLQELFRVPKEGKGFCEFDREDVEGVLNWIKQAGWIREVLVGTNTYWQLTEHPSGFSTHLFQAYLEKSHLSAHQIKQVSARLEKLLYQAALNGGSYQLNEGKLPVLLAKMGEYQEQLQLASLEAEEHVQSFLNDNSSFTIIDLKNALLTDDYSDILPYLLGDTSEEKAASVAKLRNAMTRMLFYRTELQHFQNASRLINKDGCSNKEISDALVLMHTYRNYDLNVLMPTDQMIKEIPEEQILQEQKLARAFLIFEEGALFRCNFAQVMIFKGLLSTLSNDPDKIDIAQARMGFGKTVLSSLIPLALANGNILMRLVVTPAMLTKNAQDMTQALQLTVGKKAFKDDFSRYQIAGEEQKIEGVENPQLRSLKDAAADLKRRLAFYKNVRENKHILVQAPHTRNALDNQAKIFLDMLNQVTDSQARLALMECIVTLDEIMFMKSITAFDEEDVTRDPVSTDVNFTVGEKKSIDKKEILPLEMIIKTIRKNPDSATIGDELLSLFEIHADRKEILDYITSIDQPFPVHFPYDKEIELYLCRAILTDPHLFEMVTTKTPNTDFGVWFEMKEDGSKGYDLKSTNPSMELPLKAPLLIAVPYNAANTPKARGSQFDNIEVATIATLRFYSDSTTKIENDPHMGFLIDAVRDGDVNDLFVTDSDKEFLQALQNIAQIEDVQVRNDARQQLFASLSDSEKMIMRNVVGRCIVAKQVKFDAGKACSNRNQQGNPADQSIAFSGTSGDTSSQFKHIFKDPAADGMMTIGIMGRANCQKVGTFDLHALEGMDQDGFTDGVLSQLLAMHGNRQTRALIDVGGLSKRDNNRVAKLLFQKLIIDDHLKMIEPLEGIIFFDTATGQLKVMEKNEGLDGKIGSVIVDYTDEHRKKSHELGSYFTYYDQAHSRGADIPQMDKAHAILTLDLSDKKKMNSDAKQGFMRMRKIIQTSSGQYFSTVITPQAAAQIRKDLKLDHSITGQDIALWLRKAEIDSGKENIPTETKKEFESIITNAIMQQQCRVIAALNKKGKLNLKQVEIFHAFINRLNKISPLIEITENELNSKYGSVLVETDRDRYLKDLHAIMETKLNQVFDELRVVSQNLHIQLATGEKARRPYEELGERIAKNRRNQLPNNFFVGRQNALGVVQSEAQAQAQAEAQAQAQAQAQAHAYAEVEADENIAPTNLVLIDHGYDKPDLNFIRNQNYSPAHLMKHMNHILTEEDRVVCSPAYMKKNRGMEEDPMPPVRYFLYHASSLVDVPRIYLIDQDEANLFKMNSEDYPQLTLIDVRDFENGYWESIAGVSVDSTALMQDKSCRKLLFLAHKMGAGHALSLDNIADSLEDITNREELNPQLALSEGTEGVLNLLKFEKWGYGGQRETNIPLKIIRSEKSANIMLEIGGARIKINAAIQSKIQEYMKAGCSSILARVRAEYDQEVNPLRSQFKSIKKNLDKQTDRRNMGLSDFRKKMNRLHAERKEAIEEIGKPENLEQRFKAAATDLILTDVVSLKKQLKQTLNKAVESKNQIEFEEDRFEFDALIDKKLADEYIVDLFDSALSSNLIQYQHVLLNVLRNVLGDKMVKKYEISILTDVLNLKKNEIKLSSSVEQILFDLNNRQDNSVFFSQSMIDSLKNELKEKNIQYPYSLFNVLKSAFGEKVVNKYEGAILIELLVNKAGGNDKGLNALAVKLSDRLEQQELNNLRHYTQRLSSSADTGTISVENVLKKQLVKSDFKFENIEKKLINSISINKKAVDRLKISSYVHNKLEYLSLKYQSEQIENVINHQEKKLTPEVMDYHVPMYVLPPAADLNEAQKERLDRLKKDYLAIENGLKNGVIPDEKAMKNEELKEILSDLRAKIEEIDEEIAKTGYEVEHFRERMDRSVQKSQEELKQCRVKLNEVKGKQELITRTLEQQQVVVGQLTKKNIHLSEELDEMFLENYFHLPQLFDLQEGEEHSIQMRFTPPAFHEKYRNIEMQRKDRLGLSKEEKPIAAKNKIVYECIMEKAKRVENR